jgi:hypothetical protein
MIDDGERCVPIAVLRLKMRRMRRRMFMWRTHHEHDQQQTTRLLRVARARFVHSDRGLQSADYPLHAAIAQRVSSTLHLHDHQRCEILDC